MIRKAEIQDRKTIRVPLQTAFKLLRDNRVNDHLKEAAQKIENNQPYQIVKNQEQALWSLNLVSGGLVIAGKKVDPLPELSLDMKVRGRQDFQEVDPKEWEKKRKEEQERQETPEPKVEELIPEDELERNYRVGADPLSASIHTAYELQDNVLARTGFLGENLSPEDMPRFKKLTQGVLLERQGKALKGIDLARTEAQNAKAPVVGTLLAYARGDFEESEALLRRANYSDCTQQIQADSIALLKDVHREFLPMRKDVDGVVKENKAGDGVDPFKRPYVLRGKDLQTAVDILGHTHHARLLQRNVLRRVRRFVKYDPADEFLAKLEKGNRAEAVKTEQAVTRLIDEIGSGTGALSKDVVDKVTETGVSGIVSQKPDLAAQAQAIRDARKDEEIVKGLEQSAKDLAVALDNLRNLLDAVVEPEPVKIAREPEDFRVIDPEKFKELRSQDAIRKGLEKAEDLDPALRERMVRALAETEFPRKYEDLLKAYYASFAPKPEAGTESDEKKEEAGGK
jgi:hypothetical protein